MHNFIRVEVFIFNKYQFFDTVFVLLYYIRDKVKSFYRNYKSVNNKVENVSSVCCRFIIITIIL